MLVTRDRSSLIDPLDAAIGRVEAGFDGGAVVAVSPRSTADSVSPPTGGATAAGSPGLHEVRGPILERWTALGRERFGHPTGPEAPTADGLGRVQHFRDPLEGTTASIYWTPRSGAHEVHGPIRERWDALGWERAVLGYPVTDEAAGRVQRFEGGVLVWTPERGVEVWLR